MALDVHPEMEAGLLVEVELLGVHVVLAIVVASADLASWVEEEVAFWVEVGVATFSKVEVDAFLCQVEGVEVGAPHLLKNQS